MNNLQASPGELRATVSITRKSTGKVETYKLIGRVTAEQAQAIMDAEHADIQQAPPATEDPHHGSHP